MHIISSFKHTVFLAIVAISLTSCEKFSIEHDKTDYDKLCKIYEEIVQKSFSPEIREMELSERIQNEIPNVYEHYRNILMSGPNDSYLLFKKVAEIETKADWDCKVMKAYFATKLNMKDTNPNK